jgi:hypothetical protein
MKPPVISVSVPEYTIDTKPDYMGIGRKVDAVIEANFPDGNYVCRSLGSWDHPAKTLDEFVETILALGYDKYDPQREEVDYSAFCAFDHDFHASWFAIAKGAIVQDEAAVIPSMFGDIVYHFYEHAPLSRGYPVRIDVLALYDASKMQLAERKNPQTDGLTPERAAGLGADLYKFRDPERRTEALVGIVKILPE